MATTARQQYFADGSSLSKEKREFSIADGIQEKIDSVEEGAQVNKIEAIKVNGTTLVPDIYKAVDIDVPEVIDNLYTVDSDNALSAKQGKLLYDYIQNIASRGRFLSNWNSVTGLPMTNPSESPYPYKSGDYFVVSNVAGLGGTNYRPDGSSYVIGQASTVVETDEVDVSDFYFYDGTNWLLLSNSGRQIAIDTSLSTTSTNPVENRVITNAINGKQNTLIAGNNIQIAADGKTISATDTTYSAGANISINANNEISAVDTKYTAGTNVQISNQNVISATDTKYTAGTGINIDANNVISNTQTSAEWGNITGTLSSQTDLQGALDDKQDKLTAGEGIEIGTEHSDMQGPAPDGFHVPLNTERQSVYNIWTALGGGSSDGTNFGITLKLPFTGYRRYDNASVDGVGVFGRYWSSTLSSADDAENLLIIPSDIILQASYYPANGFSVRCFKNSPTIPTSSWTKLYGTSIEAGGIFRSSADGLISMSSDGTTWITIADKNLGATAVWNDGDTLSEANCGKYYQWGNNYGFPYSGTVTTSSTRVNASNYGPGNYYNSSTFITVNLSPYSWSSVQNSNLWGGVSKGTWVGGDGNTIINTGVLSVNGQTGDVIIQTGGNYTAGDGINIDANNEISNTLPGAIVSATAPSNPTEGMVWYDTVNDALKAYNGASWETEGTKMVVLTYGTSTWQDFLDAYNKNAIVYCKVSSGSSGYRMAFMAYTAGQGTPTEVEFQYYRSRSSHSQDSTQLDEVYVYKLTNAGTWTTTQRDTGARITNGTGISISSVTSSGITTRTISADTTVLATKTDLNSKQDTLVSGTNIKTVNSNSLLGSGDITLNDVKSSATAPSSPTEGMVWYDATNDQLKVYDGSQWNVVGDDTANINTKTFYLTPGSSATAIQKGQECYDWYKAGNNPIVSYNGVNYHLSKVDSTGMLFKSENDSMSSTNASVSTLQKTGMVVQLNGDTVIGVSSTVLNVGKVLATDVNYSTVYTPQYDGSPATKKYVDDAIAGVGGGIEVDANSPIQLTKIWAGTQAQYDALSSYDSTTVYLTI